MASYKVGRVVKILIIFVLVSQISLVYGENILWLSGLASPSHQIWVRLLQNSLAERGYNLTILTPDFEKVRVENITNLHMNGVYEFYNAKAKNLNDMKKNNPISDVIDLANFRTDSCIPSFMSQGVKQLMDYPRSFRFDLVVHDFAGSQCLLGFVPRFHNPPIVGLSASTCPVGISSVSGNPLFPALIPSNHLRSGYAMDLKTMISNVLIYMADYVVREFYMAPKQNSLASDFFGNGSSELIDVWKIYKSSRLALVNLIPADLVQPYYHTVIPVGGMHIENPKSLNQDLDDFVSKYKMGIVYFALGTNIKSEYFTSEQVKSFLDAFSHFSSHGFLWKYDPGQMSQELPKNVMIAKWMPQNDILGHPSTKVFISHGGALSCQEAAWYGVPQILIPFIIDQKHNSAKAAERGLALVLDKDNLTEAVIVNALAELIYNSSYKENMRSFSRSFRDQPLTPLERAIFWIEYAIRNKDDWALRSKGQAYGFIQQMSLDVYTILTVVCFTIYFIFRSLSMCFMNRKKQEKIKLH